MAMVCACEKAPRAFVILGAKQSARAALFISRSCPNGAWAARRALRAGSLNRLRAPSFPPVGWRRKMPMYANACSNLLKISFPYHALCRATAMQAPAMQGAQTLPPVDLLGAAD
jgi:hypothetical protein